MGKYNSPGIPVVNFKPDDTTDSFYMEMHFKGRTLIEVLDAAEKKWPGVCLDDIDLRVAHIHTHDLENVLMYPEHYTNYLVVVLRK